MNAPVRNFDFALSSRHPATWQRRALIAYPLLIALAILLVLPAIFGPPLLHDSFEIDWVWADQFTAELARGNFYPRWLPLSNEGLGAPVFYYYPPLSFYLSGIFGLLGLSTYASVIAAFATAFAASGIACWHWLKDRAAHPFIGAAFFMAAPYHLLDFTSRGAQAESLAIAFIPLIAIGLRRIAERRGGLVFTAIAYAGIIFTHLPLALLTSVFLVAPYAILHRRELLSFAVALAAGIGLVAIYLVPALALGRFRDVDQLYRYDFLRTDYWSIYHPHLDNSFVLTIFVIVAVIVAAAVRPAWRHRDGWARYAIVIALLAAGIVPMLWSLPLLKEVQFPYRALPLAAFGVATALARLTPKPFLPFLLAGPALLFSTYIARNVHYEHDNLEYLRSVHPDVYEYFPKGVRKPGETRAEVVASRLRPPQVSGMVVEPTFYFPAWSCGAAEPQTQLLMHRPDCQPLLVWTLPERIGAAVSAGFALLLLAFALRPRRNSLAAWA